MTTKLTLSVDRGVIKRAKRYAATHRKSLSEIVTNYLDYISRKDEDLPDIDPEVLEAAGDISPDSIPDPKELRYLYLKEKYLNE